MYNEIKSSSALAFRPRCEVAFRVMLLVGWTETDVKVSTTFRKRKANQIHLFLKENGFIEEA